MYDEKRNTSCVENLKCTKLERAKENKQLFFSSSSYKTLAKKVPIPENTK